MSRRVRLVLEAWRERANGSLFLVPLACLVAATLLAQAGIWADSYLSDRGSSPSGLASTVEGARAILTTVATATVTVAGIAFSVALLVLQLASSQYSPRVIHGLFRDGFNKWVMGIVVGTFAYCLVVLRSVRGPLDDAAAVVPAASVTVALVLGILSLLAVVAFIDHNAHTMEVSEILQRVVDSTCRPPSPLPNRRQDDITADPDGRAPPEPGFVVSCTEHGWLQQIDEIGLLTSLPPGGTVRIDTAPGRYVIEGSPLCTVWPVPSTGTQRDAVRDHVRACVQTGRTRTMRQDPAYGIRQIVDVAVIALSPGVNDPTTAQDAIFHLAAALRELLARPEPGARRDGRGARLIPAESMAHEDLISLAYDELRRDAVHRPTVCIYLLESLHLVAQALHAAGEGDIDEGVRRHLYRQAQLVVDGCERSPALETDVQAVRDVFDAHFGSDGS